MNTFLGLMLSIAVGAPPPLLATDTPTVDRGDTTGGPILKQTFPIANRHPSETATITALESTCGCLRRSVSKSELKPGETAEVTIEVNTLTQPDGPQTWLTQLKFRRASADKAAPDESLALRLTAKLSREVRVTPPMIAISTQSEATTTIVLADTRAKPLRIAGTAATSKQIAVKQRPQSADKPGEFVFELTFSKELTAGTHDEAFVIATDDATYSELRVPIRIVKKAVEVVTAQPECLDVELAAGKGSGIVQFRRSDGGQLQISSVESKLSGVTATWSTKSGTVAALKVQVVQAQAGAKGKGEVIVTFAEPTSLVKTIPIVWGSE